MPIITIRVSENEKNWIEAKANSNNLTLTEYIRKQVLPLDLQRERTTQDYLELIINRMENQSRGIEFSIKELLADIWNGIPKGQRLQIGRKFKKLIPELNGVEIGDKRTDNTQLYKKI